MSGLCFTIVFPNHICWDLNPSFNPQVRYALSTAGTSGNQCFLSGMYGDNRRLSEPGSFRLGSHAMSLVQTLKNTIEGPFFRGP
jgi:hypothetical protein